MISQPIHRLRGFSLLELSIVLGIISLIAGAGMSMASGALKAADRVTTQERLNTIKLALDSFAKTYGYLPCPAQRQVTTSSANFGVESRNAGTDTCNVTGGIANPSSAVTIGAVPVRTLGLPDNYATDAWSNKLTYAVSNNLKERPYSYPLAFNGSIVIRYGPRSGGTNISSQRLTATYTNGISGSDANITLSGAPVPPLAGAILHFKPNTVGGYTGSYFAKLNSNTTRITTDQAGAVFVPYNGTDTGGTVEWLDPGTTGSNAGYVVVSHGPDGRGAYPVNGTAIPGTKLCNTSAGANSSPPPCTSSGTTTCIDIDNCNDDTIFYDTAYNDGTQASLYFDDYVVWGSNALTRTAVNTAAYSACPAGICEQWCAACTTNYPGGGNTAPPAVFTSPGASFTSTPQLFKKVITSDATTCSAACFWSGNTASGFIKTP